MLRLRAFCKPHLVIFMLQPAYPAVLRPLCLFVAWSPPASAHPKGSCSLQQPRSACSCIAASPAAAVPKQPQGVSGKGASGIISSSTHTSQSALAFSKGFGCRAGLLTLKPKQDRLREKQFFGALPDPSGCRNRFSANKKSNYN